MDIQNTPFVKELASSERKVRDKALESLTLFLRSRRDLKLIDLLKVWKGLFFCFYHSDKPLVQQSLARSLSYTLVPSLPEPMLQPFLRAFWMTMSRDFHSLDRLRLDKYLFLMRCYVGVGFETLLKKRNGKPEYANTDNSNNGDTNKAEKKRKRASIEANDTSSKNKIPKFSEKQQRRRQSREWAELETYISMLEEGPMCPLNFEAGDQSDSATGSKESLSARMPKGPDGIRYHLMDLWLDEIEKCATEPVEEESESASENEGDGEALPKTKLKSGIPIEMLLRPIVRLKQESKNKTVRNRATDVFRDQRLLDWGVIEPEESSEEDEDDDGWGGIED